jgi:hypothetical protein
LLDHRHFSF